MNENQLEWMTGLLIRYDKFMKIAEILREDRLYYAPGRLVEVHRRGLK